MGEELKDDKKILEIIDRTQLMLRSIGDRELTAPEMESVKENCRQIAEISYDEARLQHLVNEYQAQLELEIKKLVQEEITKNREQELIDMHIKIIKEVADKGPGAVKTSDLWSTLIGLDALITKHMDVVAASEKVDRIIAKLIADIKKAE